MRQVTVSTKRKILRHLIALRLFLLYISLTTLGLTMFYYAIMYFFYTLIN